MKTIVLTHDVGSDRNVTPEFVARMIAPAHDGREMRTWYADHLLACGYTHINGAPISASALTLAAQGAL